MNKYQPMWIEGEGWRIGWYEGPQFHTITHEAASTKEEAWAKAVHFLLNKVASIHQITNNSVY